MSAVIALCHFCDQHGPSVLINTRVQYGTDSSKETSSALTTSTTTCCACEMSSKFVSVDEKTQANYISCRMPYHLPRLSSWLQHVCVRSLSCEVNPCLFSERENCCLSLSFSVRDAMARGFYRWFSIVITMRDLALLSGLWQFLHRFVNTVIKIIQERALQVYNLEKPFRFNNPPQSRSLSSLTRYNYIFAQIHTWFSWLLRAQTRYYTECIPRSPYYHAQPDIALDGDIRSLQSFLGPDSFKRLVLGLLEGKQIILRGDNLNAVESAVKTLKTLVPEKCCKDTINAEEYLVPEISNLLGVGTQVAVPQPTVGIIRVDILQGNCHLRTLEQESSRYPTYANELLKAVENRTLNNKVLNYHIAALKKEWTNISKLVDRVPVENSSALLLALGVQDQDRQLIKFWSRSLKSVCTS
ncbi:hypothetical protein LSTR_LSTR010153 [Laodelphax striatellus]|uniref:Folliculin n=1 Tax=Laodelphax striatellus TaxID=195883 RepID=A0A482WIZ5_LAOST|nr:hypothetical protein LSTR_LSTR010153 [Laodelphax striatellus]